MDHILNQTPETEFLDQIFKRMFDAEMESIHTCVPATVESYDKNTKIVSVIPKIKSVFPDGTVLSKPKITNVPVKFAGTADAVIQFPLPKGTPGIIIISSSCLENWIKSTGEEVEPGDTRRFDLTDAFFIPGINPPKAPGKVGNGNGLEVLYKNLKVVLGDDGFLALNGSNKFIARVDDTTISNSSTDLAFWTWVSAVTVFINGLAPGTLVPITALNSKINSGSSTVKTE